MHIIRKRQYIIAFLVIYMSCVLPVEPLFVLLVVLIGILALFHGGKIRLNGFAGMGVYAYFLIIGLLVGFIYLYLGYCTSRQVLKDIVYFLLPLLYWLLAESIVNCKAERNSNKIEYYTTLFVSGSLVSLYDIIQSVIKILTSGFNSMSLYYLRSTIGAGYAVSLIALFLYVYFPQYIKLKIRWKFILTFVLIIDVLIHFSRMNLLIGIIFLACLGFIKNTRKILKYVAILIAGVTVVRFIFPDMFYNYINKILGAVTEVSFNKITWDHTSIITNWRGYEVYCELNKFNSASLLEKIFGAGFGAQLDVNGYAYLVTTEKTIPFLHNGYFTILMVWGVLGIAFYILLLLRLYTKNRAFKGAEQRYWKALVIIISVDTFFIHGLFFNIGVSSIMFYMGILYYANRNEAISYWYSKEVVG